MDFEALKLCFVRSGSREILFIQSNLDDGRNTLTGPFDDGQQQCELN